MSQPLIYLATSEEFASGEPNSCNLIPTLDLHGLKARWVVWNDPTIDWTLPDLVAIRSTWDYQDHLPIFLAWAARLGDRLQPDLETIRWNTTKSYLRDLEKQDIPIVPTIYASTETGVWDALRRGTAARPGQQQIFKPAIGASGIGVEIVEPLNLTGNDQNDAAPQWTPSSPGPWVVQPFVESVLTEGEASVFLIDGCMTVQFEKRAVAGEFRVHEERGGKTVVVPLSEEAREVSWKVYEATEKVLGRKIGYARMDLLRWEGGLVISEVEITEPQLYFERCAEHAEIFAGMVRRVIQERRAVEAWAVS